MRRFGLALGAAFLVGFGVPLVARVARSWHLRVAVSGHSMEPGLLDGDWLLVKPTGNAPQEDHVIVARDPRQRSRLIVKRVVAVAEDGSLLVAGDHPAHRREGAEIGRVAPESVVGRPWFRYWPLSRVTFL